MSDILQYVASADSEALTEMNKAVTNHLLFSNQLIAGFKVRNKIGGPHMLVQGFITKVPYSYKPSSKLDSDIKLTGLESTAKVVLNTKRLTVDEIFNTTGMSEKTPLFIFYKTPFCQGPWTTDNYLYVVCKYWSEREQDFIISIENLHELEIVKK